MPDDSPIQNTERSGPPSWSQDLLVLTKFRLNVFVLITTLFGFVLATISAQKSWDLEHFWLLFHTLLGTGCTAFGSAAFNQLMEIKQDRRMKRTADRPLPARRMMPPSAFALGWVLAAFGLIHLAAKVNSASAYLAAITLGIYVFFSTPLKRKSSINTLVGAIPGAIPPMIGWAAVGENWAAAGSWFLFALLFLWQLPHFVAINWLCREEYEGAGYKMWSDGDVSGKRTGKLAFGFSLMLAALGVLVGLMNLSAWWSGIAITLAGGVMAWLAIVFSKEGGRPAARKLFFSTLIYLPIALGLLAFGWKAASVTGPLP